MARIDELRLITKVARLYYDQELTQPEIAAQLDLSQATVSRLLKRAREEGIVRVTVNVPYGAYPLLEEQLQNRYELKEAVVVDSVEEGEQLLRDIGSAAAYYLETTLRPGRCWQWSMRCTRRHASRMCASCRFWAGWAIHLPKSMPVA